VTDGLKTTPLEIDSCPACGRRLNAATCLGEREPAPGAALICVYCAAPLVFTEGLRLRRATTEEFAALGRNPLFRRVREVLLMRIAVRSSAPRRG
jgi:hypothetical protein